MMGLNESYVHARSQVLMQIPVPSVNQAYAMIVSVESQRVHGIGNTFSSAEAVSETALMSNRMPLSSSNSGNGGYYNNNTTSSGTGRGVSNFQNNGYRNKGYGDGRTSYSAGKSQLHCEFVTIKVIQKKLVINFMVIQRRKEEHLLMQIMLLLAMILEWLIQLEVKIL